MTTPGTLYLHANGKLSVDAVIVDENTSREKLISAVLVSADKNNNTLTFRELVNKTGRVILLSKVKAIQVHPTQDEQVYAIVPYFASTIGPDGKQTWTIHTPDNAIPDSAGNPPTPGSSSSAASDTPSSQTSGIPESTGATRGRYVSEILEKHKPDIGLGNMYVPRGITSYPRGIMDGIIITGEIDGPHADSNVIELIPHLEQ